MPYWHDSSYESRSWNRKEGKNEAAKRSPARRRGATRWWRRARAEIMTPGLIPMDVALSRCDGDDQVSPGVTLRKSKITGENADRVRRWTSTLPLDESKAEATTDVSLELAVDLVKHPRDLDATLASVCDADEQASPWEIWCQWCWDAEVWMKDSRSMAIRAVMKNA